MLGLMLLAGCEEPEAEPFTVGGDVGSLQFGYVCLEADPACDDRCEAPENEALCADRLPIGLLRPIAVGAQFRLNVPDTPGITLESADDERLLVEDGLITGRVPGMTAVLARGSDGIIQDVIHIEVAEVATIDVDFRADFVASSGNFEGTARLVLLDEEGQPLAGHFPCAWASTDDAIVNITSANDDNIVDFETGMPGMASLDANFGPYTASVSINVQP